MNNSKSTDEWQFIEDETIWENQWYKNTATRHKGAIYKHYQVMGLMLIAGLILFLAIHQGTEQQTTGGLHDQTELQMRTAHFTFHFQRRDADTVRQVAPLVEQQYITLRQAVGLGAPSPDETIRIEIGVGATQAMWPILTPVTQIRYIDPALPQNPPELWKLQVVCMFGAVPLAPNMTESMPEKCPTIADLHFSNNQFTLPSASSFVIPMGVSATTVLTQSLTYLLAGRVLDERLRNVQMASGWRPMLQAIRWWLGWNGPLPPPVWINQVSIVAEPRENSAERYLADEQMIEARSLIDYAIQTYGDDKLPRLLAAFSQYDSWEAVIPAVFGVSAEQFEQGWQMYMGAQTDRLMP